MKLTPRPADVRHEEEKLSAAELDAALLLDDHDAKEEKEAENANYLATMTYLFNTSALSLLTPPFPTSLKTIMAAYSHAEEVLLSFNRVIEIVSDQSADKTAPGFSEMAASIQNTGSWL